MASKAHVGDTATIAVQSAPQPNASYNASSQEREKLVGYFKTKKKYLLDQSQLNTVLLSLVIIIYTVLISSFCYFAFQ